MKVWFHKNYKTIIILAFLIPIITVAVVSISHVTQWYGISNPFTWAIYLSIGIEIAALSALAAISANMGRKIYFPFGIVTLIQFIGNIFFAYSFIDVTASSFKSWVELVSPLLEMTGVEPTDFIGHKRFLAFFSGGMLPLISLSFLHMLVKFSEENKQVEIPVDDKKEEEIEKVDAKDLMGEISRIRLSEEDLLALEKALMNPPKPNEKLKEAYEKYNQEFSDDNDDELYEEKILEEPKITNIYTPTEEDKEFEKTKEDYFKRQAEYMKENKEEEEIVVPQPEVTFSDEFLEEAISEFNQESIQEELMDESWDVGVDPIDKDDEPVYQTESKELDNIIDIVDEAIDEKKK